MGLTNWGDDPEVHHDFFCHDIVQTLGRHLLRHPDTPIHTDRRTRRGDSFTADLCRRLEDIEFLQRRRRIDYGFDVAEEWPIHHTPPECRTVYHDKQRGYMTFLEAPTPPGDYDDDDDDCCRWSGTSGLDGNLPPTKQAYKHEDVLKDGTEKAAAVSIVHQQLTPPDSFPRKEDTAPTVPDHITAESDSEDDHRPYTKIPRDGVTRSALGTFRRLAGTKRSRSAGDIGDEDGGRKLRCQPTPHRSPYLQSQRSLKAN